MRGVRQPERIRISRTAELSGGGEVADVRRVRRHAGVEVKQRVPGVPEPFDLPRDRVLGLGQRA